MSTTRKDRYWRPYTGGAVPEGHVVTEVQRTFYATNEDAQNLRLSVERVEILLRVNVPPANASTFERGAA